MLSRAEKSRVEKEMEELALFYVDTAQNQKACEVPGLSQAGVNKIFTRAIHQQNLHLAEMILTGCIPRPEQSTIDHLFRVYNRDGADPNMIYYLQLRASQNEWISEARACTKFRRELSVQNFSQYVVSFMELEKLKEILKTCKKIANKSKNTVLRGPERLRSLFSDQIWINDSFFDCVHSQNKYVVLKLLHIPASGQIAEIPTKPSQMAVNEAFVHCLRKGYLSMAALLTGQKNVYEGGYYLGVDQAGFDEAFRAAVDSEVMDSVHWMLSGRYGLAPSPHILDEVYEEASQWRAQLTVSGPQRFLSEIRSKRAADLQSWKHRAPTVRQREEEAAAAAQRASERAERRRRQQRQFDRGDDHELIGRYASTVVTVIPTVATSVNTVQQPSASQPTESVGRTEETGQVNADDTLPAMGSIPSVPLEPRVPRRVRAGAAHSLEQAVLECMERRTGGRTLTREEIASRMSDLIHQTFSDDERGQARAVQIVTAGLNEYNVHVLGTTLYFLQSFPPRDVEVWIQGFLVESIEVHSCIPGAMNRIVTGLRGVEDPELNALFRQTEGPNMARIFLTNTFNIYHRNPAGYVAQLEAAIAAMTPAAAAAVPVVMAAEGSDDADDDDDDDDDDDEADAVEDAATVPPLAHSAPHVHRVHRMPETVKRATKLAALLVDHGITLTSSLAAVSDVLTHFARVAVAGYGVDVDQFSEEIRVSVESVMDCYEDILVLYVSAEIQKRNGSPSSGEMTMG